MAEIIELRQYRRSPGDAVIAEIDGDMVPVINISVAGVRVARPSSWQPHRNIRFRIVPQTGSSLDFTRAIPISGHVVGLGDDHLRIAFAAISPRLAEVIEALADDRPDGARPESYYGHPAPPRYEA